MKYAVIDVETNGLPDYKKPADDPCQPRLASFAVVFVAEDGTVTAGQEMLVKPDGWKMDPQASAVNGLTDAMLTEKGVPVGQVLDRYEQIIKDGWAIAGYGAQHDCKIMRGEFRRAKRDDLFEQTKNVCLMRALMPLKIPKAGNPKGWPKLDDACRFFGIEPEKMGAHSAAGGAERAACILKLLIARKVPLEATVHHAKNPPLKPS